MKIISFFAICLTLTVVSRTAAHHGSEDMKEINAKTCQPETTDDTKMAALIKCGKDANLHEHQEKYEEMQKQMYEKCGEPNIDDIKDYSKVTTDENKKALMKMCSKKMRDCQMEEWKKLKGAGKEHKKGEITEEQKKKWAEMKEKMETLKKCLKDAAGA